MGWKMKDALAHTHFRFTGDHPWWKTGRGPLPRRRAETTAQTPFLSGGRSIQVQRIICHGDWCAPVSATRRLGPTGHVTCPECMVLKDAWLEVSGGKKPCTLRRWRALMNELLKRRALVKVKTEETP